jgi:hypothetical protein
VFYQTQNKICYSSAMDMNSSTPYGFETNLLLTCQIKTVERGTHCASHNDEGV